MWYHITDIETGPDVLKALVDLRVTIGYIQVQVTRKLDVEPFEQHSTYSQISPSIAMC